MADDPKVSDAEWRVMQALWERAPQTASQIVAELGEQTGWQPTTIKTMLHRLVRKRFLAFKREGNRFLYRPRVARQECVRRASKSFLDHFFGGEPLPMMLHFVEAGLIGERELAELTALIERAEEHARV